MAKTRHIQTRMNQRGIDNKMLQLATQFGAVQDRGNAEKYILSRKSLDATLREIDRLRRDLVKARDKGGVVVVVTDDGVELTAYNLNSYDRPGRK